MEIKELNGRPLHERVIVKLDSVSDVTDGGIFLPDDAKEIANTATVVAIGNLVNREGEDLKVGERVIIQRMSGLPIDVDGERFQLVMKHDIIFVYNK